MRSWSNELRACSRLAAPIALAQLAQVAMQLVDTAIITPLGAEAIGAVGLGSNGFFGLVWPLVGILYCLDTETSQAIGRQDPRAATRGFLQAMWLWLGIVCASSVLVWLVSGQFEVLGVNPEIAPRARSYLHALIPGIAPIAFSFASTKFLQAHGKTRAVVVIALIANVVNAVLVYGLVYGRFGLPKLGIVGAGIGTSACRWLIGLMHLFVLWRGGFPFASEDARPQPAFIRELLALGGPAGLQMALEIGIFALSGFMIASFAPTTLAAHHILLQLATVTFMLPMGISAAAAVRVGQAIGAGDRLGASHSGTVAIAFGAAVMAFCGLCMIGFGTAFTRLFNAPEEVTRAFSSLVIFAAVFQVFDGIQVTATGALRGLGNTRSAFLANLIGHWLVAFPLCLMLGFWLQLKATGIWLALTIGLIVVAIALLWVWRSHAARLNAWTAPSSSAETTSSHSSTATS